MLLFGRDLRTGLVRLRYPWSGALPFVAILLIPPHSSAAAQEGTPPCSSPEASAFDFWIGEWEVRRGDGTLAGENSIRKILNGCVLHERYTTPSGYAGESFNIYDAARGVWHQTWVDVGGLLLTLEGGIDDGGMVLVGSTDSPTGPVLQRIRWNQEGGDPDRIRQLWESSHDGGKEWAVVFDGHYVRKPGRL